MSQFASEWINHDMIFTTFRAWRERLGRYRLEGSKCLGCGQVWFPQRHGVCPKCHGRELVAHHSPPTGKVEEFLVKDNPFTDLSGTHYYGRGKRVLAMITLDDGVHVCADLDDCAPAEVKVGMRVKMVTRKWMRESNSNWQYGYKFVPA